MEHLAIMKKGYIEKILSGEKRIESRFSKHKIPPFQTVSAGDTVFMQEVGKQVTAKFEVDKVLYFENLTEPEVARLRERYGKEICADDGFWQQKARSNYAVLMYVKNPVAITPFKVYKTDRAAFKTVNSVREDLVVNKRNIGKHPHDCENGKHYFVYDGKTTRCQFCGSAFPYAETMKRKPDYGTVKSVMRASAWNDEWLSVELDNVAKCKLPKVNKSAIKKILAKSIRVCQPNDGKQTPYYGNPVYYAQHGLGCCCRKCLEKFYGIPKDAVLSNQEIEYFAELVAAYLQEKSTAF